MPAFSIRSMVPDHRVSRIEINRIAPNPRQCRRTASETALRELAESIRRFGLLSPVLVRRTGSGNYELIAGERRLRALAMVGHSHADAIIITASDRDSALLALIENLQREDLHFLDEADSCRRILREHGLTQEELAATLGKSPSALANLLRLLRLGRPVRSVIREGGLSERHARALLKLTSEAEQTRLAQLCAQQGWSVRQLEAQIDALMRVPAEAGGAHPASMLMRDSRLVINALKDTVRQLRRIGVPASSRVEAHEDHYDIIVTIRTPQALHENE